jgi:phage shock protein C
MHISQPSLLARDDTFFGVCQGLGEDLGFNPNYLRVALALLLFWTPIGALAAYAGAGAVVAVIRWLVPNPAFASAAAGEPALQETAPAGDNDADAEALAVAA